MNISVDSADLRDCTARILARAGVPERDADRVADCLVFADLRGTATHGVVRLAHYVERLEAGGVQARPDIRVVRQSPATSLLEGDNGFGAVVAARAMQIAIEQADEAGVGVVVARNLNHFGAAGYYALMAAERDMIGIATGNVPALMAPTGARQAMVGNNPLAIAFPSRERPPIIWDSAMSRSSWGALVLASQNGEELAEGAFLAPDGTPTRDPNDVLAGGSLVPIAGYKGYGLALCLGLLTGVLASAPFDADLPHPYRKIAEPGRNSAVMIALGTAAFREVPGFAREIEKIGQTLTSLATDGRTDRVWLPGEKEADAQQRHSRDGIPLPEPTIAELAGLAKKFGVEWTLPTPVRYEPQ